MFQEILVALMNWKHYLSMQTLIRYLQIQYNLSKESKNKQLVLQFCSVFQNLSGALSSFTENYY